MFLGRLGILCLLLASGPQTLAETLARTLVQSAAPTLQPVEPDVPFDEAAARSALEPGEITLRGFASTKANVATVNLFKFLGKDHPAAPGTLVTLYPATPYFEAWHALRERLGKSDRIAVMSPLAQSYRIIGKVTRPEGGFEFRNLKPGRYYLEAVVEFRQELSRQVRTGNVYSLNAGAVMSHPVYERFRYTLADSNVVSAFVDVPAQGGVVEMRLR
jgi:hypothetical protein